MDFLITIGEQTTVAGSTDVAITGSPLSSGVRYHWEYPARRDSVGHVIGSTTLSTVGPSPTPANGAQANGLTLDESIVRRIWRIYSYSELHAILPPIQQPVKWNKIDIQPQCYSQCDPNSFRM